MSGAVDWVSSLTVLGVGLAVGALLVWRVLASRRGVEPTPAALPLDLRDLAAKKEALIHQLRDLEDTADKRDPSQLAAERYELELAAARTLMGLDRRLEEVREVEPQPLEPDAAAADRSGVLDRNPALRGFVWGAGSIVGVGLLLYFVSQSATERAPGGSPTGEPLGTATGAPSQSQEESQIKAQLDRNPNDVEARLALCRLLLERQDLMGVWNETQRVLELSPDEPRALSYQSLVRLAMGQPELALEMLDRALASAPDLLDAHVHKGLVLVQMGRLDEAERTMQAAAQRFPNQRAQVEELWSAMREQAAAPGASAAPARTEEPGAGPGGPPAPPPAATGQELGGTLELDPSLRGQVPAGAIIYVAVREAGGGGPPLAVSRLAAQRFPLAFRVGGGHTMTEGPWPERVFVEARIDSDGDPISRDPSDPTGTLDEVRPGTMNLRLVLRR